MPKPITAKIILAAKIGDSEALTAVARYFKPYIEKVSIRPFYDEYGNRHDLVDEEIRKHIESRLLYKIVYAFNPYRMPDGEELPQE